MAWFKSIDKEVWQVLCIFICLPMLSWLCFFCGLCIAAYACCMSESDSESKMAVFLSIMFALVRACLCISFFFFLLFVCSLCICACFFFKDAVP